MFSDTLQLDSDGNTVEGGDALGLRVPGSPNLSNQIPIWRAAGAVGGVAVSGDPQHNRSTETPGKYVSVATTVDQGNAAAVGLTVDFTVTTAATGTNITELVVINPGFG